MAVGMKRRVVRRGWFVAKCKKCRHICYESCGKFLNRTPSIAFYLACTISVYWEASNSDGHKEKANRKKADK